MNIKYPETMQKEVRIASSEPRNISSTTFYAKNIMNIISDLLGPQNITFDNILTRKYRTCLPVCSFSECPSWGFNFFPSQCTRSVFILYLREYVYFPVPPNVRITKRQLMVYEGQNFDLRCNAVGIPGPVITWRRVSGSLPSSAQLLPAGVMSFKGARTSDSGLYQCVAKNSVGTSVQTMTLYVRGRPIVACCAE